MASERTPKRLRVFLSYSGHVDPKIIGNIRRELGKYSDVVEAREVRATESREDVWKRLVQTIREADAVVAISGSATPVTGLLIECAFARAEGKPVTVVSPKPREFLARVADASYRSAAELGKTLESAGPGVLFGIR
jgi:hypothetical protein